MMSAYTWDYIGPLMGAEAERYLMRGFTTVRDVGGPTLGLKQLIDEELIRGPRIFSSGMGISQTAGHGDWRFPNSRSSYFTGERNFWTDMFGDRSAFDNTLREFEFRAQFYSNVEQLQQVTGNNGRLLELSNLKHPYPGAKLGVIEPDAYADLLIVDGDPIEDIMVMLDYETNFKLIMKDGKVVKNILRQQ